MPRCLPSFTKQSELIMANLIEHAERLESLAAAMERDSIGLHPTRGHVVVLRHLAASLRGAAAHGIIPYTYNPAEAVHSPGSARQLFAPSPRGY